ncbi:MAG TPA: YgiQ family radical SAM protein [Acholeplasmatales bacterium]|nr:MAG: YgiQ family radical SAM protein [Tenericutes bacterium GWF2_57_13]HAQ56109.1 YgiQ family radical SAM protein [Acholeplasmatales bacterium]
MPFLPISHQEMTEAGISVPDFVFVTGDAYCDHPSFGTAIIARMLERHGYTVCILSQPDIEDPKAFLEFGKPRLGWLVNAGVIDSMVNHYTVSKRRRTTDVYSPGGIMGKRPDRAVIKYCEAIRKIAPTDAIVIGGIEASLRRFAHYDYWDDTIRKSILIDSKADLLVYGMGEKAIIEIADSLASGLTAQDVVFLRGTVWKTTDPTYLPPDAIRLPDYEAILASKKTYAESYMVQYENTDAVTAKPLVETYRDAFVVQNPPAFPLDRGELDGVYDLPFMRDVHPTLEKQGHVASMDEIKMSIAINRGCFGGCSFCALTMHQGRVVQSRSKESVVAEAEKILASPDFKGYIHDVGGPTANFNRPSCDKQLEHGVCAKRQCLHPTKCPNLQVDHREYLDILRTLRALHGVKKVFIRSGIRYDYLLYDPDDAFFKELVTHHVSGQLKVAPEHVSDDVLDAMGKPRKGLYDKFVEKFARLSREAGKEQYLVPYLMSSHPGCTIRDAVILAEYVRDLGHDPEQVQDFYPTPGTLSTTMFYTELDPRTMKRIYVPKSPHDKAMQRALIQYRAPQNHDLVLEALKKADRTDLIGFGPQCLIRPDRGDTKGTRRHA